MPEVTGRLDGTALFIYHISETHQGRMRGISAFFVAFIFVSCSVGKVFNFASFTTNE